MNVGDLNDFKEELVKCGLHWKVGVGILDVRPRISMEVPTTYPRLLVFIDAVLAPFDPTCFSGASLYIGEHAVWSETATVSLYECYLGCLCRSKTNIDDQPLATFLESEFDYFYSFFLLAALGRWDAWTVSRGLGYVVSLSHDGFCSASVGDEKILEEVANNLTMRGFSVKAKRE